MVFIDHPNEAGAASFRRSVAVPQVVRSGKNYEGCLTDKVLNHGVHVGKDFLPYDFDRLAKLLLSFVHG